MTPKNKGLLIGLTVGGFAAALAYLSLSESDKKQLLKESSDKVDDLNDKVKELSDHLTDFLSEKAEDTKELVEDYSDSLNSGFDHSYQAVKKDVLSYTDLAGQKLKDVVGKLSEK
ncbi:YtxH domain-containing protein [Streptococcus iniae]|uniref:YtxH domain-containing protein n=1 Tax=Streptococcus iniae TaxID=1346 RepID=UPI0008D92441|nr:YtxH domain-containing protein [Streptococcus iniae]OHX26839.1 hypothetical protein BKX95_08285 [Streptococcus iniae]RLV27914.1 YtxH domain-containing protein [Streptococcus iniae]